MKITASLLGCKVAFLFVFLSTGLYAQNAGQVFSLQQCIDLAIQNNINVKRTELNNEIAKADLLQSKLALLPSINASASQNYNIGFAINPATNTAARDVTFRNNSFGANTSVTLFNGLQNFNNIKLQKNNQQAVAFDVAASKNNLALQVCNAYMQTLLNAEVVDARNNQAMATQEQLKRQQKLFELGGVSKVKYLQLKAQFANEESQLIAAKVALDQSYLNLWQMLNMEIDTANKIVKPDANLLEQEMAVKNVNQVYQDFLGLSPEYAAADKRAQGAKISYQMAQGGMSPRLTFGAGLNSFYTTQAQQFVGEPTYQLVPLGVDINGNPSPYYTAIPRYSGTEVVPFREQLDKNFGKNFGFTLSVPIFNGWQVNNNIQKQRINLITADLNRKQVKLDVYKNVNQAYLDYVSAQRKLDAAKENFDANQEAFLLADNQFNLGALSMADYLNTKNQFLQSQTSLLQAKYEMMFRKKVMDFYMGKTLY